MSVDRPDPTLLAGFNRPATGEGSVLDFILLALTAAVYPTLLAGVIIMLSSDAVKPMLLSFLAGGLSISLASGFVIVFALDGAVSTKSQRSASPWVDLVGGVLMLGLAFLLRRRRAEEPVGGGRKPPTARGSTGKASRSSPSLTDRIMAHGSPASAFLLGLVLNLPGVSYLVALKDIAKADFGVGVAVLLIVVFNLIMFLLAEVPLVGYLLNPDATRDRMQRFQAWLSENSRTLAVTVAAAIGLYLCARGIAGLL